MAELFMVRVPLCLERLPISYCALAPCSMETCRAVVHDKFVVQWCRAMVLSCYGTLSVCRILPGYRGLVKTGKFSVMLSKTARNKMSEI